VSENPAAHFRLWLRAGMAGCEFAKLLAGKANRMAIEAHVDAELPRTDWLNNAFDANAIANRAVIAVFPRISSERALIEFLNALGRDDRWKVRRRTKTSPAGGALVGLEWRTADGDISETMGFAPFPSMPVPRRAPYVAIATWPVGKRTRSAVKVLHRQVDPARSHFSMPLMGSMQPNTKIIGPRRPRAFPR